MGNRQTKTITETDLHDLKRRCSSGGFSDDRILNMYREFMREYPSGNINRDSFIRSYESRFPHADREFCEQLFHAHDFDGNGEVSFNEFLISLDVAIYGSAEQKLRWAFRMFDIDGNGTVSRAELVQILKGLYSLRHQVDAEQRAEKSATEVMKTLDRNHDGQLSLREFVSAASKNQYIIDIIDGIAATCSS